MSAEENGLIGTGFEFGKWGRSNPGHLKQFQDKEEK